jgi:hypothetical protein
MAPIHVGESPPTNGGDEDVSNSESLEKQEEMTESTPKFLSVKDFACVEALAQIMDKVSSWPLSPFDVETSISNPNDKALEVERLWNLRSYNILDSDKEIVFDVLTDEAHKVFGVPIAVVSLVDLDRQFFKAIEGLPVTETPRCVSFCKHVVKRDKKHGVMIVKDATKDPRFADNPLVVNPPHIRFYAGAPLITPEGYIVGSFCIIDFEARPEGLSDQEKERLELLASEAVLHMITRDQ